MLRARSGLWEIPSLLPAFQSSSLKWMLRQKAPLPYSLNRQAQVSEVLPLSSALLNVQGAWGGRTCSHDHPTRPEGLSLPLALCPTADPTRTRGLHVLEVSGCVILPPCTEEADSSLFIDLFASSVVLGTEPRALGRPRKHATTELHSKKERNKNPTYIHTYLSTCMLHVRKRHQIPL